MRPVVLLLITSLGLLISGHGRAQREPVRTYVDEPIVGWHWYNEPQKQDEEEAPPPATVPLTSLPPTAQMKVLQRMTEERLNTAILYPTVENFTAYMKMQNFWTSQASRFSAVATKSLLMHPELDYNLQYSHYNSTVPLQLQADQNRQVAAIRQLASQYGLFFFYRGNDALDGELAKVVQRFSDEYNVALIPVSMDGARSEALPQTRPDSGQAQRLGVTHLPALFLVEPGAERYQPLAYGFMTQDDLMKRFLSVATGFAPRS
ncbi:type-F conjugative transfer system pilin assembly protein TraF [Escherichia coli]|uniref:type-F conjugative transfer system pilin assembly protein TraF n=1 Tax=Escherichia coli TaxID=562 RepID=UPI0010CC19AC|nr:type-F conjugative transfer system pilin assembly protein TraF [Escherichia coli]GCU89282.1 conjugal transfer protein TraF [Escherichia coli]HAX4851857.1 type-F conjugative transfer system pilin assembly protein TraF [Escherichia coli]